MLTILKKNGAKSTAGDVAKKGSKGRLELFAARLSEGFGVYFGDYGNYGKSRWSADFGTLTAEQLDEVIESLIALRDGEISTTHIPFTEVEAAASAPATEATESPETVAPVADETPASEQRA